MHHSFRCYELNISLQLLSYGMIICFQLHSVMPKQEFGPGREVGLNQPNPYMLWAIGIESMMALTSAQTISLPIIPQLPICPTNNMHILKNPKATPSIQSFQLTFSSCPYKNGTESVTIFGDGHSFHHNLPPASIL
jgi:hypothetical protein